MASFSFFLHISALIFLAFSRLTPAQKHLNVSLGSSLTPTGPQTSWISSSGDFAFGFRPLETDSSSFLLAVWFEKIVSKTVVWYAVADRQPVIVKAGATVDLSTDGELILRNQTGSLWSANAASNASYAAMLDTGNFVIVGANSVLQWESFQDPRDTMLPSQVLPSQLLSRLLDSDYSIGSFQLIMQGDGNLVLYSLNHTDPYWASNTNSGIRFIFNQSGALNLVLKDNSEMSIIPAMNDSVGDFYQRATLDPDGVFRLYVRSKNISRSTTRRQNDWTSVGFQPSDNICTHRFKLGGSMCGFNGYCLSGGNARVDCKCLPQYSFVDPDRQYEGCKPNFTSQICDEDESVAAGLFELTPLDLDWPLPEYDGYSSFDENSCRKDCLTDCNCALALYDASKGACWKKKLPLPNGIPSSSANTSAFLKVPRASTTSPSSPPASEESETKVMEVGSFLLVVKIRIIE